MTNPHDLRLSIDGPEAEFLTRCVVAGRYPSESEVVREGLRLLERHHAALEHEHTRIRELIQVGVDQLDRGETVDGETAMRELRAELVARAETGRRGSE